MDVIKKPPAEQEDFMMIAGQNDVSIHTGTPILRRIIEKSRAGFREGAGGCF